MKKTMALILCIMMFMGIIPQIACADEFQGFGEYEETILNCEYEVNLSNLSALYGTGYWPGKPSVTYQNATEEETGRTYATVTYAQTYSGSMGQSTALSAAYSAVVGDMYQFEQVFKVGQNMSLQLCIVMGDDTSKTAYYQTFFNADGTIPKIGEYEVDKWYTLTTLIDTNQEVRTIKTYVDGELVETTKFSSGLYIPRTYQMIYGFKTVGDYCVHDSLVQKVRYNESKYTVDAKSVLGETEGEIQNFPLKGGAIKLNFSQDIKTPQKSDFKLLANDNEKDFTFEIVDKKTVIITPSGDFSPREKCILTFDSIVTSRGFGSESDTFIVFSTEPPDFHIADVSLMTGELLPGSSTAFDMSIRSKTEGEYEGIALVCIYNGNSLCSYIAKSVKAGDDLLSVLLPVPETFNETYKVTAYLIDKTSGKLIDVLSVGE